MLFVGLELLPDPGSKIFSEAFSRNDPLCENSAHSAFKMS